MPSARSKTAVASAPNARPGLPAAGFVAVGLVLGLGASAALAAATLSAGALPGCGPRSACAEVATYPVAALGVAWFAALAAVRLATPRPGERGPGAAPRGADPLLRAAAAAGALGSAGFLVAMLVRGALCPWCLAVHAGSFALLGGVLRLPPAAPTRRSALAGTATALVCAGALALLGAAGARRDAARAEGALAETTAALRGGTAEPAGFTGRWRLGPERSPVRIVVFTDYQCPDCRALEERLVRLRERHPEIRLSVMHFPMCVDCNRYARRTLHANACWAARAAEAAGDLGGAEAFFAMHRWLFERDGNFDAAALAAQARALGLDPAALRARMHADETLARVRADVGEAHDLGLQATPAVFVNGVELRGTGAADALERAVRAAAEGAAAAPVEDRPPGAVQRFVEMWRDAPRGSPPDSPWARRAPGDTGPASLRVTMWVDPTDPGCGEAHATALAALADRTGWAYVVHPFPLEPSCNPSSPRDDGDGACLAACAAEAAGLLGGRVAYWAVLDRLLAEPGPCDADRVLAIGAAVGLDPSALLATAQSAVTVQRVGAKARGGAALGLAALPCVFVNGRHVAQWRPQGRPVLEAVIAEAAR